MFASYQFVFMSRNTDKNKKCIKGKKPKMKIFIKDMIGNIYRSTRRLLLLER